MKQYQFLYGWILLAATIAFAYYVKGIDGNLTVFTLTGLGIGYVMQRSRFGFAGIVRKMYVMGNGDLARAILFLLIISLIVEASVHYSNVANNEAIMGISSVKKISMLTVIGAFLFGIGMMFAGGCASGTLTDFGEGYIRAGVCLVFFCLGSVLGVAHLDTLTPSAFGAGFTLYFPDYLGYFGSVIFFMLFYAGAYIYVRKFEARRKAEGTYMEEVYEDWEKPLKVKDETKYNPLSMETYHPLFVQRWSFYAGGAMLTVMFLVVLATTGKNWGVTTTFTYWGGWLWQLLGGDLSGIGYFETDKAVNILENGFFNDKGSLRNLGIIIGTLSASLIAGGLSITKQTGLRENLFFIVGGLLMGYGARLAAGCNIGAFYSALSAMSLSGLVFGLFLIFGGIAGLKLVDKIGR